MARPAFLSVALLWLVAAGPVHAGPGADLWPRWQAHDPQSTATINHGAYAVFLHKYVVVHAHGPNGVRYADVSTADRNDLEHSPKTPATTSIHDRA